jgi:polyisoprenoid-binding protein YceI
LCGTSFVIHVLPRNFGSLSTKRKTMTRFLIQTSSSTVNWTGKKVLGLHTGNINLAGGYIEMENEAITGGQIIIDMTSIVVTDLQDPKTRLEFFNHLLHDDFFAVQRFKTSTLQITDSKKTANNKYIIGGNLTIKDITHPVRFTSTIEVFADYLHSLGEIVIDRTLYDIHYGSGKFIKNLGDKLIYDDFVLQFKLVGEAVSNSALVSVAAKKSISV